MHIEIRRARHADLQTVLSLIQHNYKDAFPGATIEQLSNWFTLATQRMTANISSDDAYFLLAYVGNTAVGLAVATRKTDGASQIGSVYVSLRGAGVGSCLLGTCLGQLSRAETIEMVTHDSNVAMRHLAASLGFLEVDRFKDEPVMGSNIFILLRRSQ